MKTLKPYVSLYTLSCLFCFICLSACQPRDKEVFPHASEHISFSFKAVAVNSGELHSKPRASEWEDGTVNTSKRDQIDKIRIKSEVLKNDIILEASSSPNTHPLLKLIPGLKEGETAVFYFIANEPSTSSFDAHNSIDNFKLDASKLFSVDAPPEHNVMVAKYELSRYPTGYTYKRLYPDPMVQAEQITEVETYNGISAAAVPVLLYPLASHIDISFQWPDTNDPAFADFSKEHNGQEMQLSFKDFPKEMYLFQATPTVDPSNASAIISKTQSLDPRAHWLEEHTYSYYFPGTGSSSEKLSLAYTYDGKAVSVAIDPDSKTSYDLNTKYSLEVNFKRKEYNVYFGRPGITAETKKERRQSVYFTKRADLDHHITHRIGDWEIFEGNQLGVLHLGVPHRYSTIICSKSAYAPAQFISPQSQDPGCFWVSEPKEVGQAEIIIENNIPYYYQRWAVEFNVDHPKQKKPLVTELELVSSKDSSKKIKLITSFNVLSRFAKMDVGELNTFANGKKDAKDFDPDNDVYARGSYYQWGRNVAFPDAPSEEKGIVREEISIPIDNERLMERNRIFGGRFRGSILHNKGDYFYVDNEPRWARSWWEATEFPKLFRLENMPEYAKNWTSFINEQNKLYEQKHGQKMPQTYYGVNGGDPCPLNYRLPSDNEFLVVQYNRLKGYIYIWEHHLEKVLYMRTYDNTPNAHAETGLNPSGDPEIEAQRADKSFMATYRFNGNSICYALRLASVKPQDTNTKQAPSQFISAFRYEIVKDHPRGGTFLKVSCIPILDPPAPDAPNAEWEKLLNEITQAEFWADEPVGRHLYNQYLREDLIFLYQREKLGSSEDDYSQTLGNDPVSSNPEVWTSTALPYGNGFEIDLSITDDNYTDVSSSLNTLRCIRM